jgi:ribA/ribD-fused uncharacterized protein
VRTDDAFTPHPQAFAGRLRGNAAFLSANHSTLSIAEAQAIVKALESAADHVEAFFATRTSEPSLQPLQQSPWDYARELHDNYDAGHLWHQYAVSLWQRIKTLETPSATYTRELRIEDSEQYAPVFLFVATGEGQTDYRLCYSPFEVRQAYVDFVTGDEASPAHRDEVDEFMARFEKDREWDRDRILCSLYCGHVQVLRFPAKLFAEPRSHVQPCETLNAAPQEPKVGPASTDSPADIATPAGAAPSSIAPTAGAYRWIADASALLRDIRETGWYRISSFDSVKARMEEMLMGVPRPQARSAIAPRQTGPLTLDTDDAIYFYEQNHYYLSNFSAFKVSFAGLIFDTSEHAYHWNRFPHGSPERTIIRESASAHDAFRFAQEHKASQLPNWDAIKVQAMREILRAKARQHEYVRRKLLETGERTLIENSWRDPYWGWGPNRDGQNMLGKLWMEVRAELRRTDGGGARE